MMQLRDWISGVVGLAIFLLGLLPTIGRAKFLDGLPMTLLVWIVAGAGFYLLINSVVEITNSNIVGWWSFYVAIALLVIGIFPALHSIGIGPGWFEFGWISRTGYNLIFMIEGVLLMVATFAMEL